MGHPLTPPVIRPTASALPLALTALRDALARKNDEAEAENLELRQRVEAQRRGEVLVRRKAQ